MEASAIIISNLNERLDPFFSREEISKYLCGILKPKTLKNLDSSGKGPGIRMKIGYKVSYERGSFLEWFKKYIKN